MDFRGLIIWAVSVSILLVIGRLFLRRTLRTAKLKRWWGLITDRFHEHQSLRVPEFYDENHHQEQNDLYRRVSIYLHSLESLEDSDLTNLLSSPSKPTDISLSLNPHQPIFDLFLGARLRWTHHVPAQPSGGDGENGGRSFVLRIRKRDKRRILRSYLQHIHAVSEEQIEQQQRRKREIRLFTSADQGSWRALPFTHPATMETVVLDAEVKAKVKSDLEVFLKSRQYYHRLGRAWRRSYLLYGPSGTGKSSFVAAMAKLLSYDVYEVNLSRVSCDSDLKLLLLRTSTRSLILLEDFDRFILHMTRGNNNNSVVSSDSDPNYSANGSSASISGVLNFMDGVVSSCCEERVMVFTMTTKENIDPIVLRPGRVDVHIRFPMCDFNSFKCLAGSHLGVRDHKLFPQVEEMFLSGATLSPAEVGELMAVNRNSPSRALKSVINALQTTSGADGRSLAAAATGVKKGRRVNPAGGEGGESVDLSDTAKVRCRNGVKEFRKLYGLLRKKSLSRSESLDLDS